MSPVFRHGRLRLYLLRLLDEEPRHGYDVIRMLRDQFMGVYAPSPGTIYPRLARLEEEGLVAHDEVDGRKVYRITDAGRAELHQRTDELTELERELSDSVSDVVREVKEDVRDTVRSLREELTWAARAAWRGEPGWGQWPGLTEWPGRRGWSGGPDVGVVRDVERIVREFTGDLRRLAWQAGVSAREEALTGLRAILADTLDRIRDELFGEPSTPAGHDAAKPADTPQDHGS